MEKIVIVGAGYAGVLTAKKLERKLKKRELSDTVEITLIDKKPFHTMLTELHEVAAGRVEEDSVKISLKRIFESRDVTLVQDKVSGVDYSGKKVICGERTFDFDYLVIASGSQPAYFGIPGVKENAFTLWSYEDAIKLREHILDMFRKAAVTADEEEKRKLLTFYVIGASLTGVEMAGELAEFAPALCSRFEIDPSLVKIVAVDVLDRVCPVLPDKLAEKVRRRLERMGVEVALETKVTAVGQDFIECIECVHEEEKNHGSTYTVVWTAGVEGSEVAKNSAGVLGNVERGRIETDEYLRSKSNPDVFIAGDNIYFTPEDEKTPVPQMVENCEHSSGCIAHNIVALICGGKEEMETYRPKFHGIMVCVGGRYGVAHVGTHKRKISLPSFLAMFVKHFINVIYFWQVLGWNKFFSYMCHEFFTVRNRRSFVGGHLSNRAPSFFLVPLRVFLGAYWVYEAIDKISQGWLAGAKMKGYLGSADSLYQSILGNTDAVSSATNAATEASSSAADAASSATAAAASASPPAPAGTLFLHFDFLGFMHVIVVHASDYAIKIQIGLADYFTSHVVLASDSSQITFQAVIVISELLIGLLLIGGLFTTPASVYSLVLQALFVTSTGLYLAQWWMIFAAIAMLFGASRVFSFDYYVMPVLKRRWGNIKFVRKWYLYND